MNPFAKGVPSVFVVSTPFQALCAIAAINQLEIDDFLFLAHLPYGSTRNQSVVSFLESRSIEFKSFTLKGPLAFEINKLFATVPRNTRYKRVFVGNHFDAVGFLYASRFVSNGSPVVYLDDGDLSISLFQDRLIDRMNHKTKKLLGIIARLRHFTLFQFFLTIYGGIINSKYIIEKLDLCHSFKNTATNKCVSGVYILGTVLADLCQCCECEEEYMKGKLEHIVSHIKAENPTETVYFIPHGRDTGDYSRLLCDKYGCVYYDNTSMVEVMLMNEESTPHIVYGFTSSALYSLKYLFPNALVKNILLVPKTINDYYVELEGISKYYLDQGITLIKVNL